MDNPSEQLTGARQNLIPFLVIVLPFVLLFFAFAITSGGPSDAKLFVEKYTALTYAYDPALADLYTDTAEYKVYTMNNDGSSDLKQMTGSEVKSYTRTGMPEAAKKQIKIAYKDFTYEKSGDDVIVRARLNYADICYWDNDYHMTIRKNEQGQYQIIEERLAVPEKSQCKKESLK